MNNVLDFSEHKLIRELRNEIDYLKRLQPAVSASVANVSHQSPLIRQVRLHQNCNCISCHRGITVSMYE
jgi:hypothetical protein